MTDNEKRAHDIAVSMLPTMFENKAKQTDIRELSKNGIDIIALYENLYSNALNYFNSSN